MFNSFIVRYNFLMRIHNKSFWFKQGKYTICKGFAIITCVIWSGGPSYYDEE